MASRIDKLNQEIKRLKDLNKSLTESCQELEKEINTLRNQQDIVSGVNQADYIQLKQENDRLNVENDFLRQKIARQERDINFLKSHLSVAPAERPHNERGAGRKPRITPEQIAEIQSKKQSGMSYREIAKEVGFSPSTIFKVCKN